MFRKFIKWMEFNPPYALDADGWNDFNARYRKEAPIRYFLTEKVWFRIEMIGYRIKNAVWEIRYRTTDRNHVVNTGLEPGYYDTDTLLLHTSFTMLVDYVEHECAWMHVVFDDERRAKALGWKRFLPHFLRVRNFRSREAGLAHLDWEATLDDPNLPLEERCDHQAEKGRKAKELYLWWVDERPQRVELPYPDINRPSGVLATLSERWKKENPEDSKKVSQWAKDATKQETDWDNEDTEKLIELIKIRKGLWT